MERLHVIAAHDSCLGIGKDGGIPWHLPPDLRRFRRITMGHSVVMGRRTWNSIGARPLPGRRNLIVSTTIPRAYLSLEAALEDATEDAYVIGGTKLFSGALRHPKLASVDLTHVYGNFGCDTHIDLSGIAFVGTMILGHETRWRDLTYQTVTYQSGDLSASQVALRSKEGVS